MTEKKNSLRAARQLQSVANEQKDDVLTSAPITTEQDIESEIDNNEATGLDKGRRKSPRINITLSRNTHEALKAEIDLQHDKGLNVSMSRFIDDLIREKLELD
mgnify:CR=1 FL=1